MTLLQELGLVEAALGDVAAFAAGQPVSGTIPGTSYHASVGVLPNGPTAEFPAIGGGFFGIISVVLSDAAAFAAGQPVKLAVKENRSWYGLTLSQAATPA